MIKYAFTPAPALGRVPDRPQVRRTLACTWVRCPDTGALICQWDVAAPELVLIAGSPAEGERPPSPLSFAA